MLFIAPIVRWFNNPELLHQMHFDSEVKIVRNGSTTQRVYSEMWTGKWWEQAIQQLPIDKNTGQRPRLVVILAGSDKTHLSARGTANCYST